MWDQLERPWQICLEEAWTAYGAGSVPIGAAVVDGQGQVVARGRNRLLEAPAVYGYLAGLPLAHAEVNALAELDYTTGDLKRFTLYTTMEPCPQCLGALYMSGLSGLHYAARDPWAGATDLLGATPYMRRKPLRVARGGSDLELVSMAINVEHTLWQGDGYTPRAALLLEAWRAVLPAAVAVGEALYRAGDLQRLLASAAPVQEVVDYVAELARAGV